MAGKLTPMRELRALAKRAGMRVDERMFGLRGHPEAEIVIQDDVWDDDEHAAYITDRLCVYGEGKTKRAAQIQARANAKRFLEAALAMEYGEKEDV